MDELEASAPTMLSKPFVDMLSQSPSPRPQEEDAQDGRWHVSGTEQSILLSYSGDVTFHVANIFEKLLVQLFASIMPLAAVMLAGVMPFA